MDIVFWLDILESHFGNVWIFWLLCVLLPLGGGGIMQEGSCGGGWVGGWVGGVGD